MFDNLKNKIGFGGQKPRKYARGKSDSKICISILSNYKPGDKRFSYGECFSSRTFNISAGGVCIAHPDKLTAGVYIMINSRNNLKRTDCLDCGRDSIIDENFTVKHVIGKVIWRSTNRCGIKFIEIDGADKRELDKRAKASF